MDKSKENKQSKISEGILLAVISGTTYLLSFLYEANFVRYFNIPISFIKIDLNIIISFGSFLFFIVGIVVLVPDFFSSFLFLKKIIRSDFGVVFAVTIFLGLLLLTDIVTYGFSYLAYWRNFLILIASIWVLSVFFFFVFPLIKKRKTKGQVVEPDTKELSRREGVDKDFSGGVSAIIARNFGIPGLLIGLLFAYMIAFVMNMGHADAIKQEEFLVLNTSPERVVLRVYGDNIICATFNRETREVDSNFSILKMADDPNLSLKLEKIGPLLTDNSLPKNTEVPISATLPSEIPVVVTMTP